MTTPTEAMRLALDALDALHKFADSRECRHEITHRGGAIWTICDDCGRKWSDDRNPFKPWVEPAEFSGAEAAITALREAIERDGWQPIDTVPKTGRKLILSYLNRNNYRRTVIARWLTDEQAAETDADDVGLEGGWYECIDNWDDYTEVAIHEGEPTHWMPLPAAPKD